MATRKISQKEWAFEVKRALKNRQAHQQHLRKEKYVFYEQYLQKLMPLPYLIGVLAAVALLLLYGWQEFLKFLLGWVVSVTLVAMFAYHLWKHYEKDLRL